MKLERTRVDGRTGDARVRIAVDKGGGGRERGLGSGQLSVAVVGDGSGNVAGCKCRHARRQMCRYLKLMSLKK